MFGISYVTFVFCIMYYSLMLVRCTFVYLGNLEQYSLSEPERDQGVHFFIKHKSIVV